MTLQEQIDAGLIERIDCGSNGFVYRRDMIATFNHPWGRQQLEEIFALKGDEQ